MQQCQVEKKMKRMEVLTDNTDAVPMRIIEQAEHLERAVALVEEPRSICSRGRSKLKSWAVTSNTVVVRCTTSPMLPTRDLRDRSERQHCHHLLHVPDFQDCPCEVPRTQCLPLSTAANAGLKKGG
jgi:hypothetical protein